jgi:hypothetical protein
MEPSRDRVLGCLLRLHGRDTLSERVLFLELDWNLPHKGLHALLSAERIPEKDCISCSCFAWYPTLRNALYHCLSTNKGARNTSKRFQEDTRKPYSNPTPETVCLTTAFNRPIRIIVDPDELIPWITVRIRTTLLVLDSALHLSKRTTLQKVQTSLTPALPFATCSLFAPLFLLLSFPSVTTSNSRQPHTLKPFLLQQPSTKINNMPPKGSVSHLFLLLLLLLQFSLCLPLHPPLSLRLGSTRARASGTRYLFGSARA